MNLKSSAAYIGLIAGSILTLFTNPANAAVLSFGNNGIKFDTDTDVNFKFVSSQGQYQSNFGVYNVASETFNSLFEETKPYDTTSNDYRGTCEGIESAVANCGASFKFLANVDYSLALLSQGEQTVYSTDSLNNSSLGFSQQAKFIGTNPTEVDFEDHPFDKKLLIDFNDFKVNVFLPQKNERIPEPAMVVGLVLVGTSILLTRHRKFS